MLLAQSTFFFPGTSASSGFFREEAGGYNVQVLSCDGKARFFLPFPQTKIYQSNK